MGVKAEFGAVHDAVEVSLQSVFDAIDSTLVGEYEEDYFSDFEADQTF